MCIRCVVPGATSAPVGLRADDTTGPVRDTTGGGALDVPALERPQYRERGAAGAAGAAGGDARCADGDHEDHQQAQRMTISSSTRSMACGYCDAEHRARSRLVNAPIGWWFPQHPGRWSAVARG